MWSTSNVVHRLLAAANQLITRSALQDSPPPALQLIGAICCVRVHCSVAMFHAGAASAAQLPPARCFPKIPGNLAVLQSCGSWATPARGPTPERCFPKTPGNLAILQSCGSWATPGRLPTPVRPQDCKIPRSLWEASCGLCFNRCTARAKLPCKQRAWCK